MKLYLLFLLVISPLLIQGVFANTGTVDSLDFSIPMNFEASLTDGVIVENSLTPMDFSSRLPSDVLGGGRNIGNEIISYHTISPLNFTTFSSSSPLMSLIGDFIRSDVIALYLKAFSTTIDGGTGIGSYSSGSLLYPDLKMDLRNLNKMKIVDIPKFGIIGALSQFDTSFNVLLRVGKRIVGVSY